MRQFFSYSVVMPLTLADLNNIDAAIATAELEVEIDGKRVKYRSTSELLAARRHVESVLSAQSTPRTSYRFRFTTGRGD
ncbi:phage head-tail joining protein [Undibacterium rivi]|uniref:phage head-tail joining protein n=1 Tax=Undibacterium rivi TaxID=2828729 RepID=UPI0038B4619F